MWRRDDGSADEAGVILSHRFLKASERIRKRLAVKQTGSKMVRPEKGGGGLKFCGPDWSSVSRSLLCTWRASLPHKRIGQPWFLSSIVVQLPCRAPLPVLRRSSVRTPVLDHFCSRQKGSQTLDSGGRSGERKGADLLQRVFGLTPWEIQTKTFFYWQWLKFIKLL